MKNFQLLIAIAILLAACKLATSDEIIFTDKLRRAGGQDALLKIQCKGPKPQTWGQTTTLTYNASIKISMPKHQELGKNAFCFAGFRWEAESFGFVVYSYARDHKRCVKSCKLEARWDGLYGFNDQTNGWDLVARYPIHPLGLGLGQ
ncbi:uncharacterized protein A4U43_C07F10450 [Asparagus officinalis]|uniref:S-protein homolog n=1 Tax=Asparagus officinalis TaxID=4686 RepID=A0A5P1EG14_ASPOF|nr:uncharacterized protein A4U43_C07F10450 [Asparagus officinalis]